MIPFFAVQFKYSFLCIRCTSGVECWNTELVKATSEAIADAVEWVGQTPPQTPPIRINVAEAIIKALAITEVSTKVSSVNQQVLISPSLLAGR